MNILFCLNTTFNPSNGGIANVSLTIANGLEKKGHNCYYLSIYKNSESVSEKQYFLPQGTANSDCAENKLWFSSFVRDKSIDVIINQNGTTPYSLWAVEWARENNIKALTVYHSSLMGLYSFHKLRLNAKSILKKIPDGICRRLFRIKYGKYYRKQIELSDKVVTLSDKFFHELEWFSRTKIKDKCVAIPNAINNEQIRIEPKECEKRKELLFVGRLSPEKQPDLLVRIWHTLSSKFPEWQLTIVGDGILRSKIEKLIKNKSVERVSLEGYQEPWKYYQRAKILCMTSAFEGFGLVLAEAMSLGTVPIAFNSYANINDIVENGVSGLLIEPFSKNKYAKGLSELMNNSAMLDKMSVAAKEKAKCFSLSSVIKQWNDLLESLHNGH